MSRVVILRPEPGASATMERARAIAMAAHATPLFRVEPVIWAAPDPNEFDALLLTSANAVWHAGPKLAPFRQLSVHAVGSATAATAHSAGLTVASIGTAGVDELLRTLPADARLLHLAGADRVDPGDASQAITAIIVYRSVAIPDPALALVDGDVILVHSPRAGRRLANLVTERSALHIAAISDDAATAVGEGWSTIETAPTPSDAALLALAAKLCDKPAP